MPAIGEILNMQLSNFLFILAELVERGSLYFEHILSSLLNIWLLSLRIVSGFKNSPKIEFFLCLDVVLPLGKP